MISLKKLEVRGYAKMRNGFKKYFVAIWVLATSLFLYELTIGFSAHWITGLTNYLYVVSLIFLFLFKKLLGNLDF